MFLLKAISSSGKQLSYTRRRFLGSFPYIFQLAKYLARHSYTDHATGWLLARIPREAKKNL